METFRKKRRVVSLRCESFGLFILFSLVLFLSVLPFSSSAYTLSELSNQTANDSAVMEYYFDLNDDAAPKDSGYRAFAVVANQEMLRKLINSTGNFSKPVISGLDSSILDSPNTSFFNGTLLYLDVNESITAMANASNDSVIIFFGENAEDFPDEALLAQDPNIKYLYVELGKDEAALSGNGYPEQDFQDTLHLDDILGDLYIQPVLFPQTAATGQIYEFRAYVMNIGDSELSDITLTYTLPSGWSGSSGALTTGVDTLLPGEVLWNNIGVFVGIGSSLDIQGVLISAASSGGSTASVLLNVSVYANTTLTLGSNASYDDITGTYFAEPGDSIVLTTTLKDGSGNPLEGERVTFYDQTSKSYIGSGITDRSGGASLKYTIPVSLASGFYAIINSEFDGDDSLLGSTDSIIIKFNSEDSLRITEISRDRGEFFEYLFNYSENRTMPKNLKLHSKPRVGEPVVWELRRDAKTADYYETSAPQKSEEEIGRTKRIIISSDAPVHYYNVTAFTELPELKTRPRLFRIVDGSRVDVTDIPLFNVVYLDTNDNGRIDRLEWNVPRLSNDTYEIVIEITNAEHLDGNREFISDIYEEVFALDGTWSEPIYSGEYIRVRFERNLTSANDITFYARNVQALNTLVEVYHYNSSEKILEFPIIGSERYYKMYLTGMDGMHDRFDLKVANTDDDAAYLEFDHIIDPPDLQIVSPENRTYAGRAILVDISASDPFLDDVWYNWNGTDQVYSGPIEVTFDEGQNILHAWANDTSGGINYTNVSFTVRITPAISFVSPPTPLGGSSSNESDLLIQANSLDDSDHYTLVDFDESILGWYRFESGDATDSSSKSNDGTVYGASPVDGGLFGAAMDFDGSGNYIDTEIDYGLSTGEFSLFAWVKDIPSGNRYVAAQTRIASPYSSDWILGYPNGGLWFRSSTVDGGNVISNGNWHLIGLTFNGTTARLYIDGSQYGSSINPAGFGGIGTVKLMTRGDATTSFTSGLMDDVLIINRTLSIKEIGSLYNATSYQYNNSFSDLSEGNHSFTAYAVNSYGRINQTEERDITLDDSPPAITIDSPLSWIYFSENQSVEISASDSYLDSIWFNWNGTDQDYSSPINVTFTEGVHTLFAFANDTAGNMDSENVTFTINLSATDYILPSITIHSPIADEVYEDENILVNITAFDTSGVDDIWYNHNGTDNDYASPVIVSFGQGSNLMHVWANDTHGNTNYTNVSFYVDSFAPDIEFVPPTPDSTNYTTSDSIYVSISSADLADHYTFVSFNNDLLGWYRLEEQSWDGTAGEVIDDSAYNHDGRASDGANTTGGGKFGRAGLFDGNNDYIDTTISYSLSAGSFSVFAWVKDMPAGNKYIVSQTRLTVPSYSSDWILGFQNGGLWFRSQTIDGGDIISDGDWHLIGFTFNGTSARLYIDDAQRGSPITPADFGGIGTVKLMTRGDATSSFVAGLLDDVLIINRTLNLDEIKSLYDAEINQYENNFTGLADGNYSIRGFAVDSFGNKNETELRDIKLDATSPNITINSPENITYPMNFILLNISETDDDLDRIWYNWNGTDYTYASPVNITFAIGQNTLHVWANDSAGNIAYDNVSFFAENEALTGCGIISSPGKRVLSNDITSLQTCLFIQSNNVEIDCDGHSIIYDTSGASTRFGIDAIDGVNPRQNLTVRNCFIIKPTALQTAGYGIRLTRFSNSTIVNNTIRTNGTTNNHGIFLTTNSADNVIEDNAVYASGTGAGSIGIYVYSYSGRNTIRNNQISTLGTTTTYGVLVSTNSHNAVIEDNIISTRGIAGTTTSAYGVYIYLGSDGTTISGNEVHTLGNGGNYGIYLQSNISNNDVLNNNISTYGTTANYGIHLLGTAALPVNGNDVSYNTVLANGSTNNNYGIYVYTNTNSNTINYNNVTTSGTTTNHGIFIRGIVGGPADRNTLIGNRVLAAGTAAASSNYGIYLNTNVNHNLIHDNTISTIGTTANYGIYGVGTTAQIAHTNITSNTISPYGTTTNNAGIYLINNITDVRIEDNSISTSGTTTNYGVQISGTTVRSNGNSILRNSIATVGSGANNHGVYLYQNVNSNNVLNNNISTYGTATNYGVYGYGTAALSVNTNVVAYNNISTGGSAGSNHGVYLSTNANSNNVTNNRIFVSGTTANYAAYIVGAAGAASNNNQFRSNILSAIGSTTYNSGVLIVTNANTNTISDNNITTSGTTNNYGVYLNGDTLSCDGNKIISNIVNASGTGNANYGLYMYRNVNSVNATGNTISTSGTTTNHGVYAAGTATEPLNSNIFSSNVIDARGSLDPSTNYGIYLTTNANNNIITNNNVSTSGTTGNNGISVLGAATATSNSNNISNNRVSITATTNNNWGIYLATNTNSNRIFGNQVDTSGSSTNHGVYISGATYAANYNSIYSNDIYASGSAGSNYGLYLYRNVNYANVSENNISTSGTTLNHGLYAAGAAALSVNNSIIRLNRINASGSGITNYGIYFLTNVNKNTVENNDIFASGSTGSHGVFLSTTLAMNNFSGNTVAATGLSAYAFYLLVNANYNSLSANEASGAYGYYFESSSHNTVRDCGPVSGSSADVFVNADITPTSLNNTFLNCTYLTESVAGAGNYLNRKWYFQAFVNNSLGYLENANVTGYNLSDMAIFTENTTASGTIPRQEIEEYVNLQGSRSYKTPHTFIVSKPAYTSNTTAYNISEETNIRHFVLLEQDSVPPIVTINLPKNTTYTYPRLLLNISVVEDNLDEFWYDWNATNTSYSGLVNITFNMGSNTIIAWANDTVGNINSSNVTFSVISLDLNITSPLAGTYPEAKLLVEINSSYPPAIDKTWYNWNGTNITYTGPVNVTFVQGYNTLTAWANDSANNIVTTNVTFYSESNAVSSCINISAPGKYVLNQNITGTGTCLQVASSNVEIDCKGYSIIYDTSGVATRMGINAVDGVNAKQNLTVRNCIITKPNALQTAGYGIMLTRFSNSTIVNNTIRTNGTTSNFGIHLTTNSADNLIENNQVYSSGSSTGNSGIYLLSGSSRNTVRNNNINTLGTTTSYGVWVSTNSDRTVIEGNTISARGTTGTTTSSYGIYVVSGALSTSIEGNNITTYGNGGNYGICLQNLFFDTKIRNNVVRTSGTTANHGIYATGTTALSGNRTEISFNNITTLGSTTNNYGIYLYRNVNVNNITGNRISTSGTSANRGIYLLGVAGGAVNNNLFEGNIIQTSGSAGSNIGIDVATNVNHNQITGNDITTSGTTANYGLQLLGTTLAVADTNITLNRIRATGTTTNNFGVYLFNRINGTSVSGNNISTSGTDTNYGLQISGANYASDRNTISSNSINATGTGTTNYGIYLYRNVNSNSITNNVISTSGVSANYAVYAVGTTALPINGNSITSNSIRAYGSAGTNLGVYLNTNANSNNITENNISTFGTNANYGIAVVGTALAASNNNIISSNRVKITATTTDNWGIYMATNANSNTISRNHVSTSGSSTNHGVYISGATFSANSNVISSNNISTFGSSGPNYGVYLYQNVNNANVTRNNVSTSGTTTNHGVYGIGTAALSVNNNLIDSNRINASGTAGVSTNYGVVFVTNANSNTVRGNSISTYGSAANYGVYFSGATFRSDTNSILLNNISTHGTADSNYGIYLYRNVNSFNITGNSVSTSGTTNNYGIYLTGTATLPANSNTIRDNSVQASGSGAANTGIYFLTNASNNVVEGNEVTASGTTTSHGMLFSTTLSGNQVSGNTVSTSGTASYGFYMFVNANSNTLARNNASGVYGYYFESASNNLVSDCGNTAGSTGDVFVNADITPQSLNNTFLNCTYTTESVAGAGNYLTRKWYLSVFVNNSLGYLENANVTGYNVSSRMIFSENTTALGTITRQEPAEYVNLQGSKSYKTPHEIRVTKPKYTTNVTSYNLSVSKNVRHFVLLEQDVIPPRITIYSPQNRTYEYPELLLNVSMTDDNPDSVWYNWNGTNYTYTTPFIISFPEGQSVMHVWANDTAGNSNYTNVSFTILFPDLTIEGIRLSDESPVEGQNITFHVNITNEGGANATGFRLQFNISSWNISSTWGLNQSVQSGLMNLTALTSRVVNFSWVASPGAFMLVGLADSGSAVTEGDEGNNLFTRYLNISAWHVFYGDYYNFTLKLGSAIDLSFMSWNSSSPEGNLYYSDVDSSYSPFDLVVFGDADDFLDADRALDIVNFTDSISALYDADDDGAADYTADFEIGGVLVEDVPVINSTTADAFVTGILWDSADGAEYDGTQDIVFITKINRSQAGGYGTYDYEAKVPSNLKRLKPGADLVERFDEIFDAG